MTDEPSTNSPLFGNFGVGDAKSNQSVEAADLVEHTIEKTRLASGLSLMLALLAIILGDLLGVPTEYQPIIKTISTGGFGIGLVGMFQTVVFDMYHLDTGSQVAIVNAGVNIAIQLLGAASVLLLAVFEVLRVTVDGSLPASSDWLPFVIGGLAVLGLTAPYLSVYITANLRKS